MILVFGLYWYLGKNVGDKCVWLIMVIYLGFGNWCCVKLFGCWCDWWVW